jgi:hypothetical protein
MDSGPDEGRRPSAQEERVNQKSGKEPLFGYVERTAPAPYGTVTPAAERARQLADRLRESLAAAGFEVERDFPSLRGDITVSNEPFLTLGRLRPDVSEHLVAALANARRARE